MNIKKLETEQINTHSKHIDVMSTKEILKVINDEDQTVAKAVEKSLPQIEKAVDCIYKALSQGGRLIYFGAGTSGRLGVLDASECPPTYGVDPQMVQGIIAGGETALTNAIEGAEDSKTLVIKDLDNRQITKNDVICGIAASGRTPYVKAGLEYGNKIGCQTISICCVSDGEISKVARYPIEVVTGPEVVTGSTRMKSGTAQKMVLNMLSSATMIKLGKVFGNMMVDVQPTNEKLCQRSIGIVSSILDISEDKAKRLLEETGYDVKITIIKEMTGSSIDECKEELKRNNNNISLTIQNIQG